jgi:hypothetical protein
MCNGHTNFQEREHVPANMFLGPLPENAFVAAARDSIPSGGQRITTASTRGNLRGRGRGRSNASRAPPKAPKDRALGSQNRGKGT